MTLISFGNCISSQITDPSPEKQRSTVIAHFTLPVLIKIKINDASIIISE